MAKAALRMTPIAPCDGTDISELKAAAERRSTRLGIPKFLMERGNASAVVIKQCMKLEHMTMYLRICAVLALIQISSGTALAVDDKQPTNPPIGLFTGTPEEQAACSPDATRLCRDAIPDTFRVLGCLQENRQKLRKVCLKVLEDHGQ